MAKEDTYTNLAKGATTAGIGIGLTALGVPPQASKAVGSLAAKGVDPAVEFLSKNPNLAKAISFTPAGFLLGTAGKHAYLGKQREDAKKANTKKFSAWEDNQENLSIRGEKADTRAQLFNTKSQNRFSYADSFSKYVSANGRLNFS